MQGLISSAGNIDAGGQGGDVSTLLRVRCSMGGVSPTSTTTINGKIYNTFPVSTSYVNFYTVTQLNDEEQVSISDISNYIFYPISNNNSDVGCILYINNGALSGNILSTESELSTVEFIFTYVIDLSQPAVTVTELQNYTDLVIGGGASISYLPETVIEPYPTIVDTEKQLSSNLLSDTGGLSISGYDDGGNYINISSTFSSTNLMSIITSSYTAPSATTTDYITVNTGNKYINRLSTSLSSGGCRLTVTWYNGDTVITTEQYTMSSTNTYHQFVAPNATCNKARIEIYRYQKSLGNFKINVFANIACKANNIDIPGLVYGNLQAFPLPVDGINNIRTINSKIYANYDTNYQTGLNLITYDGSNIHYYNSTSTNV